MLNKGLGAYQCQLEAGTLSTPNAVERRLLDRALLTLGRDSRLRRDYLRGRWQGKASSTAGCDWCLRRQYLRGAYAIGD
jgi:hypothetical protein